MTALPLSNVSKFSPSPRRQVTSSVYTNGIWITGNFVLPKLHGLTEHLNRTTDFYKLTDVRFSRESEPVAFLALQREAITLIVPALGSDQLVISAAQKRQPHDVSCLLPDGMINGTLDLGIGLRVSDFLAQDQHFFALRDCSVLMKGAKDRRKAPLVIFNRRQLVGVSEPQIAM